MRLRTKFILSMFLSVILPVLAVSIMGYLSIKGDILEKEGKRLEQLAATASLTFEKAIKARENELSLFASMDSVSSSLNFGIYDEAESLLEAFKKNFNSYRDVFLADATGNIVASTNGTAGDAKVEKELRITGKETLFSKPYFDEEAKGYFLKCASPVVDNGKIIGSLLAVYDLDGLYKELDAIEIADNSSEELGHIMIFDSKGAPVYAPEEERVNNFRDHDLGSAGMEGINEALLGKSGNTLGTAEFGKEALIGFSAPSGTLKLGSLAWHDLQDILAATHSLEIRVSLVAAASIILGIIMAVILAGSIVRPIMNVVESLKDLAKGDGDLTIRLPVSGRDEVSELGHAFNDFVEKIQGIVVRIAANSKSLVISVDQLSRLAEGVGGDAKEQSNRMEQAASTATEMAANVAGVAKNAALSAEASKKVETKAEGGKKAVEQTAQGMTQIAEHVNLMAKTLDSLGSQANKIGTVVSVIDEIADQTNLLALNAAIEAARAGEYGRGFAVVADEVRKLAERTTRATKEIIETICSIQTETKTSVEAIQVGVRQVDKGLELAKQASTALDGVFDSARNGAEMAIVIAASAEEQAAATDHISQVVEMAAETAKGVDSAGSELKVASECILDLATQLNKVVSLFKISEEQAQE